MRPGTKRWKPSAANVKTTLIVFFPSVPNEKLCILCHGRRASQSVYGVRSLFFLLTRFFIVFVRFQCLAHPRIYRSLIRMPSRAVKTESKSHRSSKVDFPDAPRVSWREKTIPEQKRFSPFSRTSRNLGAFEFVVHTLCTYTTAWNLTVF